MTYRHYYFAHRNSTLFKHAEINTIMSTAVTGVESSSGGGRNVRLEYARFLGTLHLLIGSRPQPRVVPGRARVPRLVMVSAGACAGRSIYRHMINDLSRALYRSSNERAAGVATLLVGAVRRGTAHIPGGRFAPPPDDDSTPVTAVDIIVFISACLKRVELRCAK